MRSSVQPQRRSSGLKRRTDELILDLKFENNFDDSSWYDQKVTGLNPNVVPTSTKTIEYPGFDPGVLSPWSSFISKSNGVAGVPQVITHSAFSKYSAAFGVEVSTPLKPVVADTHGRLIQSNGLDWTGEKDTALDGGDLYWDNVVLMVRANQSLYGTDSFDSETYRNKAKPDIANYTTPIFWIDKVRNAYYPPNRFSPHGSGKFDDSFFSFGMVDYARDRFALAYKGESESFDFSDTDFTVEFWAKPEDLSTLPDDSRTNLPRYNTTTNAVDLKFYMDSVILSTASFVIGYCHEFGFVASIPNGQASTKVAHPDLVLRSSDKGFNEANKNLSNSWNHVSLCKKGSSIYLFVNGEFASGNDDALNGANYVRSLYWDGTIDNSTPGFSTGELFVGIDFSGQNEGPNEDGTPEAHRYNYGFVGSLDELRITKGVCRYTYMPVDGLSASPDSYADSVVLKIISETTDGDLAITDSSPSPKTITRVPGFNNWTGIGQGRSQIQNWVPGTPGFVGDGAEIKHVTSNSKFGNSSLFFNPTNWMIGGSRNNWDAANYLYPCVGTIVDDMDSKRNDPNWDGTSDDWDWTDENGDDLDFTIELWMMFDGAGPLGQGAVNNYFDYNVIMSKCAFIDDWWRTSNADYCEWVLVWKGGRIGFGYRPKNEKKLTWVWSSYVGFISSWGHVAVQRSKDNGGRIEIYLGGNLVGQSSPNASFYNTPGPASDPNQGKHNVIIGSYGVKWPAPESTLKFPYGNGPAPAYAAIGFKSFSGNMEDIRITKGVARYGHLSRVPTLRSPLYKNSEITEEIYYDLSGDDFYLIKSHAPNELTRFKDITNDQTEGYDYCRVSCEGLQQGGYWSKKNQGGFRGYANNDYLVYAGFTNESNDKGRIRFLTIKRDYFGTRSCNCDSFTDIKGQPAFAQQFLSDGKYIYDFNGWAGNYYISVYKVSQIHNSDGSIVYAPTEISSHLIESSTGYLNSGYTDSTFKIRYNQASGSLGNWRPVTQVVKDGNITNIYIWCRVIDANGFYNYGRANDVIKSTYPNVDFDTYHFQHYQFIHNDDGSITFKSNTSSGGTGHGEAEAGNYPAIYDSKYWVEKNGGNPSFYAGHHASTFVGKSALNKDTIFVLEPLYSEYPRTNYVGLALHGYDIDDGKLSLIGMGSSTEVVFPKGVSTDNVFAHNGYIYAGDGEEGKTYVYRFENGFTLTDTVNDFVAGYGVGDYVLGKKSSGEDYLFFSYTPRRLMPLTQNPQSILVSGSGVYSNGPDQDSAIEFDLAQDFTIEGWAKLYDVPHGTEDDPGMTLFDFGSIKLSNTSGFFTVETVDEASGEDALMDYYDPNFIDPDHEDYLPNRFIHFAVQRTSRGGSADLELWLGHASQKGDEKLLGESHMKLVAEDRDDGLVEPNSFLTATVTGNRYLPYNSARAVGSTVSGTNFFTGHMENFRVWKEAIYGPQNLRVGGPYADGIFTSEDGRPSYFYYYYYIQLKSQRMSPLYKTVQGYVNNVPMYEGGSITMFCTAQTYYDPRYSVNVPLPITIDWYKTNNPYGLRIYSPTLAQITFGSTIIGSSAGGAKQYIPPNYYLNYKNEGELWIRGLNGANSGFYSAIVKIGDPTRPKFVYTYTSHLVGINLTVMPFPSPPPPPKAVFSMFSCNTCRIWPYGAADLFPDGAPDLWLNSHGQNSPIVELGGNAEILASFYPWNQPWKNFYQPNQVLPPQPISYNWTNKGRGTQSDRSRLFASLGASWRASGPWPCSSLKFTNIRKGIKGPICCEAEDSNGVPLGKVCCAGITLILPKLLPPETTPPSVPATSTADWEVVDYKTTLAYKNGQWQSQATYYKKWTYEIKGKEGFLQANLKLAPLAFDPNVAELLTGGLEYKWKIIGIDEGNINVNIQQLAYGNDTEQTYIISENFKGTVTCEIQLKNYPADQWSYDPEGRRCWGRKATVIWNINAPECYEPYGQVYNWVNQMNNPNIYNEIYMLRYAYLSNSSIVQLGGGKESDRGEYTVYFQGCEKMLLPFAYLNGQVAQRAKWAKEIGLYYGRGLTTGVSFDGSFWNNGSIWNSHPNWQYYSGWGGYYPAAIYPDYLWLGRTLYKNDDGKSTEVVFSNSCG